MPGPEYDDIELLHARSTPDAPDGVAKLRARLLEQLETEIDAAALQGTELALVALREPLEPGPVAALLHHVAEHLEQVLDRQDDELARLRRRLRDQDEELQRIRRGL